MGHVYYFYRAADGREMPAVLAITTTREAAEDELGRQFAGSRTPLTRVMSAQSRPETRRVLAACRDWLAKTHPAQAGLRHQLGLVIEALEADLGCRRAVPA